MMKLSSIMRGGNLASELSKDERQKISGQVYDQYLEDEESRAGWKSNYLNWQNLSMQIADKKTSPWPNAANVLYPLLSIASTQFAARTYPAMISGAEIVKIKVSEEDPSGEIRSLGNLVARDMSWLLMDGMPEFETDMDRMLHSISIPGIAFKKTFWDKRNNRPHSGLVLPKDLVTNYYTKSLDDDTPITHIMYYSDNEIQSQMRRGVWRQVKLNESSTYADDVVDRGFSEPQTKQKVFLEQHCLYDLDGDGYAEPYIVTIEESSKELMSMVPRFLDADTDGDVIEYNGKNVVSIKSENYFTKYPYIPAADGGFYDSGLGQLLGPINDTVNTVLNQMIDAGTLQNLGGGWMSRGLKMKGGSQRFSPGEYKFVDAMGEDLRKGIFPLPTPGPSSQLFSLLGMLVDAGEKMSSMTDPMVGKSPGTHIPATSTLALIEQGNKVFSGVTKRLHRSFKEELNKIYRLQRIYSDNELYDIEVEIYPYTDPSAINPGERMAKAGVLMELMGHPLISEKVAITRQLQAADTPNIEEVWAETPDQPDPQTLMDQAESARKDQELQIKMQELEIRRLEAEAKVLELKSKALKNLAEAGMDATDEVYEEATEVYQAIGGENVEQNENESMNEGDNDDERDGMEGMERGSMYEGDDRMGESPNGDNQYPPVLPEPVR